MIPYFVILLGLCGSALASDSEQSVFEQANELYRQKKYEKALRLYEQIEHPSSQVNFNMGNSAYQIGQLGYAYLYFRRAQKNGGIIGSRALRSNMALLKEKLAQSGNPLFVTGTLARLSEHIKGFVRALPLGVLQALFLILWLTLFFWGRRLWHMRTRWIVYILFFLVALGGILLVMKYAQSRRTHGVVVAKRAIVRSGPAEDYTTLLWLPEAAQVLIKESAYGFYKIKIGSVRGWVSDEELKKI